LFDIQEGVTTILGGPLRFHTILDFTKNFMKI